MKKSLWFLPGIIIASLIVSCGGSNENRPAAFGTTDTSDQKPAAARAKTFKTGEEEYSKYCLACHQADGNGVRGQFPPLAGNDAITGPADTLIRIVLFGLEGPITVNGQEQNYSQAMPPQDYLTDEQIADVLSFIRNSWGNKAPSVKPENVGEIRKAGKLK